jgi:plastocyanin domain-containing protein
MQRHRKHFVLAALTFALSSPAVQLATAAAQTHDHGAVREIEVVVDGGYKPNRVEIHAGERVRLKFVRKDYSSCTREVVFPSLNIKRELPTNQPVVIELPALAAGEYEFRCGMNMIRGTLVVTSHG